MSNNSTWWRFKQTSNNPAIQANSSYKTSWHTHKKSCKGVFSVQCSEVQCNSYNLSWRRRLSPTSQSLPTNVLVGSGNSGSCLKKMHRPDSDFMLFEMTKITQHVSIHGPRSLSAHTSSGTCRHSLYLCANTRFSVCQVRHNCSAIHRSAEWINCRQVTNLNGARIFCIIQQSDGAAVFPLKIPDAATHKSAQHLHRESLLCV